MFRNYLKIAGRNLWKNKLFTFIHFFGISIALVTCLLLAAFVYHELQYDKLHDSGEHIHRLNVDMKVPGQELEISMAAGVMAPNLQKDFPEVEAFVRLARPWSDLVIKRNDQSHFEKNILYADSSFFELFDFRLVQGDPSRVLHQPDQVVFTESLARKYFGDLDPVGEQVTIDNKTYTISGLAADPPQNSHIDFDCLINYQSWIEKHPAAESNWTWTNSPTYLLLRPDASLASLQSRLDEWIKTKVPEDAGVEVSLLLQPFESIYFSPARLGDLKPSGSRAQMWLLSFVGLLILFMALFNYVNLATALYTDRAREVGVRKTFGASKRQIVFQFLSESVLLAGLAITFAFISVEAFMPGFNALTGKELNFDFINPISLGLLFIALLFGVGLLAGIYPSLMISGWRPVQLFRGKEYRPVKGLALKHVLVGAQFFISIGLIVATLVIWDQHRHLSATDPGFEADKKIVLRFGSPDNLGLSPEALKKELQQLPGVNGVAFSSHVPSEMTHGVYTQITDENGEVKSAEMDLTLVDPDFINVFGMELIAGRNFSSLYSSDTTAALILNESALNQLGFSSPQAALGRDFSQWDRRGKVIGVIRDYNHHSLHAGISPMTFQVNPALFEKVTLDFRASDLSGFLGQLEAAWRRLNGLTPFQYTFLDEQLSRQYEAEQRFSQVFAGFSLLAILISCLGLYGLLAITVSRRLKEIGIRKVLGAGTGNILYLLSKYYIRLVAIALLIASPFAWYFLSGWLDNFAYRIELEAWHFLLAGAVALVIALVAIAGQGVRAVLVDPVESLRGE